MNAETLLLLMRLASVGLEIISEMEALIRRVREGEEITDAEIEASGNRVDAAVTRWQEAAKH